MRLLRYSYLLMAIALSWCTHVQAQERVFSEYQYDEVGNTTQTLRDLSGAAPRVDNVSPTIVRQNQSVNLLINGEGLRGAQLQNADGFFEFRNTQTSNTQITTTLLVDAQAQQGPSQISVSTSLGVEFISLEILAELPDLRIAPSPLVLLTGSNTALSISLSTRDVLDHQVSVSIADSAIASLSASELTFPQESLKPDTDIQINALSVGRTSLTFDSSTLGQYTYTLTVTDNELVLTPGQQNIFYGAAVGVNKLSPPVPDLLNVGPVRTSLRIIKEVQAVADDASRFVVSNNIGLLKGSYLGAITPQAVGAGESNVLVTVTGEGLQSVDNVSLLPATGVTIEQLTVNPNGESLTLELNVDAGVALNQRKLTLTAAGEIIPAISNGADRISIGGVLPVISSLSPIYFNRGDIRTITVTGQNFESVRSLRFDNNDNLLFTNPVVSNAGTRLTFTLQVVGFALLGPRQLILESVLGDGLAINVDANVIRIQDLPSTQITPLISPLVGLLKQVPESVDSAPQTAISKQVGISKGAVLTGLSPTSRSQGSNVTLQLQGVSLDSVDSVEFVPNEGITVGAFTAAADGSSASLQITIDVAATAGVRQLRLLGDTGFLPAQIGADRFTVTLPTPEIISVSPLQIEKDSTGTTLQIRGRLLNSPTAVMVLPTDGILVNSFTGTADGSSVQATITVSADAASGPRVVVVTTPGGDTELVPLQTNTIQIVQEVSNIITPILSAPVGVNKQVTTPPEFEQVFAQSNSVGLIKQQPIVTPDIQRAAYGNLVGVSRGPSALTVTPDIIPINTTNQTIEVTGIALDDVTTISTVPADGVTLNGPAIIANDGSKITFSLNVDESAPQTLRRVRLQTATSEIPFLNPVEALLRIAGLEPEIISIAPIQQVRGASFVMTIRGINFVDVQSVQATPSSGITFGEPSVAADNRSLSVAVSIDSNAAQEQKVISITTIAGNTSSVAVPANTFTVISN